MESKRAIVYLNESGEVESVSVDDETTRFEIQKRAFRYEIPKTVIKEFCPVAKMNQLLKQSLVFAASPRTLAMVPWANARVLGGSQYCDISAYVLPANAVPEPATFFPLQWRYASGFSMIEIEPMLDEEKTLPLTEAYLIRKEFTNVLEGLTGANRGANHPRHIPGFILQDTVQHLMPFASTGIKNDPILNTFDPTFMKHCRLKLQDDDYIGFFKSDWADVSIDCKKLDGHSEAQSHFYLLVKYTLPSECADQLKHVLHANPHNDTWQKLITRKIFTRAQETARAVRHAFLKDTLASVGLQARRSNPDVVDTEFDLFDPTPINVTVDDGPEQNGIVFFSGSAPTTRADNGMLIELGPERDHGMLWLHGQPAPVVGGSSWKQLASVNSLPVLTPSKLSKKTLELFGAAGWNKQNGYAKLTPIHFI
jgi:hypothetical protein